MSCARKKNQIHGEGTKYSIFPGSTISIRIIMAASGIRVITATAMKSTEYHGSTLEPSKRLAVLLALRLAIRL
jgi:hypothetical protein